MLSMDGMERWRQDCAHVGLAGPSVDLKEIKRAYAVTLRSTRPDDDAQAYQALREAYDRLVAYAKHHAALAVIEAQEAEQAESAEQTDRVADVVADDAATSAAGSVATSRTEALADEGRLDIAVLDELAAAIADAKGDMPAEASAASPSPDAPLPVRAPAPASAPRAPLPEDDVLPDQRSPEALTAWVETLALGEADALTQALPILRAELARLPFSHFPEASVLLADLLIQLRARAPMPLVVALHERFAWQSDFRAERLLGRTRMARLLPLLAERPLPVTDPELLAFYGPTVNIARWLTAFRYFFGPLRGYLAVMLMGFPLLVQLYSAGPTLLRRLQIDGAAERNIHKAAKRTQFIPLLAIMALACGLQYVGEYANGDGVFLVGSSVGMLMFGALIVHNGLERCRTWLRMRFVADRDLAGWERFEPWFGLALLAAGGLLSHFKPSQTLTAGCLGVMALMFSLPQLSMFVCSCLLWVLALVLLSESGTPMVAALLAVWVWAGPPILAQRLYQPERERVWTPHPGWPRGGVGAVLVLSTVGLPVLVNWLAARCGMRLAIGAMVLATGIALRVEDPHWRLLAGALLLPLCLGLLLAGQRAGWRMGRWLMRQAPGA